MKILLAFFALALASGGGWWWWQNSQPEEISYQTSQATRGDITQSVTATGILNPVRTVQVGSQISGNILKLNADFNSIVTNGEPVAEIDPSLYDAALQQATGDLENAIAGQELAEITSKRTGELRKQNVVPQSQLDQANATLHQAQAQVKIKQGALAKAKADRDHCIIYSPIDGIVISRAVDVGQTVAASLSAPVIFQVAGDLTKMQIDASVAEADVGLVQDGQDVNFTVDAFPYQTFHGKVMQIRNAPITVQNVVTYDTVISVNNDELKLKPGMTANISIIVAQRKEVIKMANAAMRFHPPDTAASFGTPVQDKPRPKNSGGPKHAGEHRSGIAAEPPRIERTIYVLRSDKPDAKPEPVKIKTGISDGIFTEVIEGVTENETLVTGINNPEPEVVTASSRSSSRSSNPFGGVRR
jgi:HlyD family secretion protein